MRVASVVYVDHQDAVGYPIDTVVRSLLWSDRILILTSDDRNASLVSVALKAKSDPTLLEKLSINSIGARIGSPSDIARAMNRSIEWTKRADECDFILVCPADTLSTKESIQYCKEFMSTEGSRGRVAQFPVQESKLYHDFGNGYGQTLMGRDWPGRFSESCDGSRLSDYPGETWDSRWWHIRSTLHIGYLSIDAAYRHQRHESKSSLWGGSYPWLDASCKIYERQGREAFVRYMLPVLAKVHNVAKPSVIDKADKRFGQVIDGMGLRAERNLVAGIADQVFR